MTEAEPEDHNVALTAAVVEATRSDRADKVEAIRADRASAVETVRVERADETENTRSRRAKVTEDNRLVRAASVRHQVMFLYAAMLGGGLLLAWHTEANSAAIERGLTSACVTQAAQFTEYKQGPGYIALTGLVLAANPGLSEAERGALVSGLLPPAPVCGAVQ